MEVLKNTVKTNQQTATGKTSEINGTVISGQVATVKPSLGSVYKLQFRVIQESLADQVQNSEALKDI